MENRTKPITTSTERLNVSYVMEMISNSQQKLKQDIRFLNYRYGNRLSKDDQEEILATVTYKALEAAATYDPAKAKMRTWLNKIANNEIITYLKARDSSKACSILYVDENDGEGCFPDEIRQMHYRLDAVEMENTDMMRQEHERESLLRLECLNDAITSLSRRDKSVVFMLLDNFSGREMADALKIKEGAQRKLVSDVRGRLKKYLTAAHFDNIAECTNKYRNSAEWCDSGMDETLGFLYTSRSNLNG